MLLPEGLMHRKIHLGIALGVLAIITLLASFAIAARAQSGGTNPSSLMSTLSPGTPLITTPYGGQITASLDCSTKNSCYQNVICTIINCVLQVPFVLHFYNGVPLTMATPSAGKAKDALREKTAEPLELKFCSALTGFIPVFSSYFCQFLLAPLQKTNTSPAGKAVEALGAVTGGQPGTIPAVALILFPDQGAIPACSGMGQLLGMGYGQGVSFSFPQIHQAGDSCRGSYYMNAQ